MKIRNCRNGICLYFKTQKFSFYSPPPFAEPKQKTIQRYLKSFGDRLVICHLNYSKNLKRLTQVSSKRIQENLSKLRAFKVINKSKNVATFHLACNHLRSLLKARRCLVSWSQKETPDQKNHAILLQSHSWYL